VETVEIHSGLFPPSEAVMVYHQMVCLVVFMAVVGPIRSWWTLPMERAFTGIKGHVVRGGKSFDISLSMKEFSQEDAEINDVYQSKEMCFEESNNYYCANVDKDDDRVYSDMQFRVLSRANSTTIDEVVLTEFELGILLKFLVHEAKKLAEPQQLLQNSSLFRLHMKYQYYRQKIIDTNDKKTIDCTSTFYDWISYVYDLSSLYKRKNLITEDVPPTDSFKIYKFDFEAIQHIKGEDFKKIRVYKSALIWGTRFKARGKECREMESYDSVFERYGQQTRTNVLSNSSNILSKNYSEHVKSWCKVYDHEATCKQIENDQAYKDYDPIFAFGLLNFFTVLSIPHENVLSGVPIASITLRKHNKLRLKGYSSEDTTYFENVHSIDCDDNKSLIFDCSFVALHNIYATPIAIAAFEDSHYKVPIENTKIRSRKVYKKNSVAHHDDDIISAKCLVLYSLERRNECIHNTREIREAMHPYFDKNNALVRIKNQVLRSK
jgi:hypothetical protein